ncbi:hypothetical protein [Geodermatophilus sp. URMC 64]
MSDWLIDETETLSRVQEQFEISTTAGFEGVSATPISVTIRDVTIHDTRRLFGAADIRLDAICVTVPSDGVPDLYSPTTFRFSGVRDHEQLPIDKEAKGMLLYSGYPAYFLDVTIAASRAADDQPDLAELLAKESAEISGALGDVSKLAFGVPAVGVVTAAAAAAARLSGVVFRLLSQATGRAIGLYRATWFQNRDDFGLGVHPSDGERFRKDDLEFRYEIFRDEKKT